MIELTYSIQLFLENLIRLSEDKNSKFREGILDLDIQVNYN